MKPGKVRERMIFSPPIKNNQKLTCSVLIAPNQEGRNVNLDRVNLVISLIKLKLQHFMVFSEWRAMRCTFYEKLKIQTI